MKKEVFYEQLKDKGIVLSEIQMNQFEKYFQLLVEWNEKMNLTAITDEDGVYAKHFFDSISAAFYFDFTSPISLIDVGAGAGFPSIPIKICFPHIKVSIVDSLNKRIQFLTHLAQELNLSDVNLYHSRAEDFAQHPNHREKYDLAMARAVARLNVLAELCIPLTKVGGHFLAMKGAKGEEELQEAKNAIKILGAKTENLYSFELPEQEGERSVFIIKKEKNTSKKYPRKAGVPNKEPLK